MNLIRPYDFAILGLLREGPIDVFDIAKKLATNRRESRAALFRALERLQLRGFIRIVTRAEAAAVVAFKKYGTPVNVYERIDRESETNATKRSGKGARRR